MSAVVPPFPDASHPPEAAAVLLRHVSLAHGSRTILDDVSLSISPGEFVGVLGPNGAGKTTLMRALIGLLPHTGEMRVLGEPVRRGNPAIGYMPQIRASLAGRRIAGRDLVAAAVDGHHWGIALRRAARDRAVHAALDRVGAIHLADRPVGELSGGERQRLLLAQCLVGEPKILLLDEPLISLDPHRQQSVVTLIRDVARALDITVLFSAHELNPLLGAIDRVLYLGNGSAALGTVDEVITAPILSRLYGAPIDVMRVDGRVFVMSGGQLMDRDPHGHTHDDGDAGHGHGAHDHDAHEHGTHDHAHAPLAGPGGTGTPAAHRHADVQDTPRHSSGPPRGDA
ncbi:metal ABC transporter ATP-binding protein [Chitinasiproducens palmae]|uniref:metal ABC transporter ATP-binding protein n=1 Tax=Chitinasiproducens palmae TaxID=1770053 RepID=UPI001F2C08C7|nr:ATP-binding cassette domain-containing protein [Chitinasiproducens palmae]